VKALSDKVAIVTGSGQGVGRGIALALAAEGAAVVLAGRTLAKVETVADEVRSLGARALALRCDVKEIEQIDACVAETLQAFGTIDILVNNAQEPPLGAMLDVADEDFQAGWASGPLATFRFMKACHPHLRNGGVIINLGSSTTVNPNPSGRGAYSALKAATQTLTRVAAVEWGPEGIRAVAIMPAAWSPASDAFAKNHPEDFARSLASIPLRRLGDPLTDIGRAVAFLCSSDAAYITGTTIALDGGQAYLR
jgi:NAD(P)-dependent dehydrogenase (short-subunit alcohol dehydrogenase family)